MEDKHEIYLVVEKKVGNKDFQQTLVTVLPILCKLARLAQVTLHVISFSDAGLPETSLYVHDDCQQLVDDIVVEENKNPFGVSASALYEITKHKLPLHQSTVFLFTDTYPHPFLLSGVMENPVGEHHPTHTTVVSGKTCGDATPTQSNHGTAWTVDHYQRFDTWMQQELSRVRIVTFLPDSIQRRLGQPPKFYGTCIGLQSKLAILQTFFEHLFWRLHPMEWRSDTSLLDITSILSALYQSTDGLDSLLNLHISWWERAWLALCHQGQGYRLAKQWHHKKHCVTGNGHKIWLVWFRLSQLVLPLVEIDKHLDVAQTPVTQANMAQANMGESSVWSMHDKEWRPMASLSLEKKDTEKNGTEWLYISAEDGLYHSHHYHTHNHQHLSMSDMFHWLQFGRSRSRVWRHFLAHVTKTPTSPTDKKIPLHPQKVFSLLGHLALPGLYLPESRDQIVLAMTCVCHPILGSYARAFLATERSNILNIDKLRDLTKSYIFSLLFCHSNTISLHSCVPIKELRKISFSYHIQDDLTTTMDIPLRWQTNKQRQLITTFMCVTCSSCRRLFHQTLIMANDMCILCDAYHNTKSSLLFHHNQFTYYLHKSKSLDVVRLLNQSNEQMFQLSACKKCQSLYSPLGSQHAMDRTCLACAIPAYPCRTVTCPKCRTSYRLSVLNRFTFRGGGSCGLCYANPQDKSLYTTRTVSELLSILLPWIESSNDWSVIPSTFRETPLCLPKQKTTESQAISVESSSTSDSTKTCIENIQTAWTQYDLFTHVSSLVLHPSKKQTCCSLCLKLGYAKDFVSPCMRQCGPRVCVSCVAAWYRINTPGTSVVRMEAFFCPLCQQSPSTEIWEHLHPAVLLIPRSQFLTLNQGPRQVGWCYSCFKLSPHAKKSARPPLLEIVPQKSHIFSELAAPATYECEDLHCGLFLCNSATMLHVIECAQCHTRQNIESCLPTILTCTACSHRWCRLCSFRHACIRTLRRHAFEVHGLQSNTSSE